MAGAPNNIVFPCCLEINLVNVYPTFLWLSSVEEAHERTHCHFWLTLFPPDRTSWTVWIWIEPTWCKCCILYILYYILCTGFPFKKRTGVTVRHGTLKLSTTIQHPRNAFFQSNSLITKASISLWYGLFVWTIIQAMFKFTLMLIKD